MPDPAPAAPTTEIASDSLAEDVIRGIKSIAQDIGESERRTLYLCERGYIPVGKEGRIWVASRRVLREHYARITAGSAN
jgi:hypothetical protein